MSVDLNHVTLSGSLTQDPVLGTLPSGKVVCEMRVAIVGRVSTRRASDGPDSSSLSPLVRSVRSIVDRLWLVSTQALVPVRRDQR